MALAQFYQLTENEATVAELDNGSIVITTDSGNLYLISVEGERLKLNPDVTILPTEASRTSILAPIPNKFYAVVETGKLWIYYSGGWKTFGGGDSPIIVPNFEVAAGASGATYSNDKIKATSTATFTPDASIQDLITEVTATCAAGSCTVKFTGSYNAFGILVINP